MKLSLFARIELLFWDFAIQTLSNSGTARTLLRQASSLMQQSDSPALVVLLGMSGVVGLVSG
jgi:hypothetical protein